MDVDKASKTAEFTAEFTIGPLSKRTGCNIETIRYFERIGLMPQPPRTQRGHRLYSEDHLKRLTFIRRCRELQFTQSQVRDLLLLVDSDSFTCDEVKQMTLQHAGDVRQKIADLRKLERVLKNMVSECNRGAVPECPVINTLFEPA